MSCVRYYFECTKCAHDFYSTIKPIKKCQKCDSIKVLITPEFDEENDHEGSIKSSDGELRWC